MVVASPAAADEVRSPLAVTAEVVTSCVADSNAPAPTCSGPTPFVTKVSAHPGEQPLAEAAAMLGAPERSDEGLRFGALPQAVPSPLTPGEAPDGVRYRTITY